MFIALQRKLKSVSWFWLLTIPRSFFLIFSRSSFFQRWAAKNLFHKHYALTCFGRKLATYRDKALHYTLTFPKQNEHCDWLILGHVPLIKFNFTVWNGLMLLWFTDLMNVTEEVTTHRPNVSTLLSSAFIRGDVNAATRGPFLRSLISCLFSDEV